ncbi:MAG: hypothetical protein V4792_16430 [Pseudomonadota bacterium]
MPAAHPQDLVTARGARLPEWRPERTAPGQSRFYVARPRPDIRATAFELVRDDHGSPIRYRSERAAIAAATVLNGNAGGVA